jgi:hypothetical protein
MAPASKQPSPDESLETDAVKPTVLVAFPDTYTLIKI